MSHNPDDLMWKIELHFTNPEWAPFLELVRNMNQNDARVHNCFTVDAYLSSHYTVRK